MLAMGHGVRDPAQLSTIFRESFCGLIPMRGMLFFASKPPARSGAEDTYKDLRDIVIPKRFVCNKKQRPQFNK